MAASLEGVVDDLVDVVVSQVEKIQLSEVHQPVQHKISEMKLLKLYFNKLYTSVADPEHFERRRGKKYKIQAAPLDSQLFMTIFTGHGLGMPPPWSATDRSIYKLQSHRESSKKSANSIQIWVACKPLLVELFGPNLKSRMVYSLWTRLRSTRICTFIALYNVIWVMKVHYLDI